MHIDDLTLGEAIKLIEKAYKEGWKTDDGFLLACGVEK